MNRHLVSVEVGVERGTNQRVQLDCLTFYQYRLECLNSQSVQCRGTVQKNRMILNDVVQDIPDFRLHLLYHGLCALDVVCLLLCHQFLHDERLEQFQCHGLWQTALIELQSRADNDYGTAGVVNTLTQQVLTETSLLTLEHIRQRFQGSSGNACYRSASSAVVNQRVYRFLQHSLLVSNDNVRGTQLQQLLQSVVSVDYPAVQIVQVGSCETSAFQLYHRTEIRRNYRNNVQNHPLRSIAGLLEGLDDFQSFYQTNPLLTGRLHELFPKFFGQLVYVDIHQQLLDCFRTHCRLEVLAVDFSCLIVLGFLDNLLVFKRSISRIRYDVGSKIEHSLQILRGNIQNQTDSGWDSLEVPDVGHRCN